MLLVSIALLGLNNKTNIYATTIPKMTEKRNLNIVIFKPKTRVKSRAVMLLAFPAVKNEITISHDVPFLCNLLARGIIPHVHNGIRAPIMLDVRTKTIPFELKIFSKKLSGMTSASTADINKAIKKAGKIAKE